MPDAEWYYAQNGAQNGPVLSATLRQLARAGRLAPGDLVWKQGMAEWVPASRIRGLFPQQPGDDPNPVLGDPAEKLAQALDTVGAAWQRSRSAFQRYEEASSHGFWDALLNGLRSRFSADFLASVARIMTQCGTYALALATLVCPGLLLMLAVRADSFVFAIVAACVFVVLAVLMYVARRIIGTLDALVQGTPSRMASAMFLDSLGLFWCLLTAAFLLLGIYGIMSGELDLSDYLAIIVSAAVTAYSALLCFQPSVLNVSFARDVSLGEEAVGVVSAWLKVLLQTVPVSFGTGAIVGTLGLVIVGFRLLAAGGEEAVMRLALGGVMSSELASDAVYYFVLIVSTAMGPFITYLLSIFLYMLLDVVRCILIVPGKLDRLADAMSAGQNEEEQVAPPAGPPAP